MAYVQPNGVIQIFKGINLDNRYMHTIYFASETAQNNYFSGKLANYGRQFDKQYYTRQNGGMIRLKVASDEILDYTYMRFQNKATNTPASVTDPHSTKWFYAFITSINYVNENVTEITFEIDVMQTWFIPNGTIRPCMVLRNHVSDDTFGKHLEAEPVGSDVYDMDEIECADMDDHFDPHKYSVVMQTTSDPVFTPFDPHPTTPDYSSMIKHGMFNGIWEYHQVLYSPTGTAGEWVDNCDTIYDEMMEFLGSFNTGEQLTEIVNIIQYPTHFINNQHADYDIKFILNAEEDPQTHIVTETPRSELLGNYVPQNKKLCGYPYSYLYITTMDGDNEQLRWEYFDQDDDATLGTVIGFIADANETSTGVIALYPKDYNGVENHFDAKLTMSNFPKCPFVYDAYQAWVASGGKSKIEFQTQLAEQRGAYAIEQANIGAAISIGNNIMSGVASGVRAAESTSGMSGTMAGVGGVVNAGLGVAGAVSNNYYTRQNVNLDIQEAQKKMEFTFRDARYKPNQIVGAQAPTLAVGNGHLKFRFFSVHVKKTEMIKIDDFLTVYGYAINQVQTPSLTAGKYWTFLKTEGCVIDGNMPSSSKEAISRIIDGGIFFWKNGDNVGNFEVENRNQYGALVNK